MYFGLCFDEKQKQMRVIKNVLQHNEAVLGARDADNPNLRIQDVLFDPNLHKSKTHRVHQRAAAGDHSGQPNAPNSQPQKQPMRKVLTSQGVNDIRNNGGLSSAKSLGPHLLSSTRASNLMDKTKTHSNFSHVKAKDYCVSNEDSRTPRSLRKLNTSKDKPPASHATLVSRQANAIRATPD